MSAFRSSDPDPEAGRERASRPGRASVPGPPRIERSAGGVVVRRIEGRPNVLLIRDPYGKWGLPKGHVERGEEERDAALREVREETGLGALEPGPRVSTIDWYFRKDGELIHKFCTFFLVHAPVGEPDPELEEGITECVWLPGEHAADRVEYANTRTVVRSALEIVRDPRGWTSFEL